MKKFLCLSLLFFASFCVAQQPEFSICNIKSPVSFDSLKKCHKLTVSDSKILIQNFEVVFNSVQGMAMYTMGGTEFNNELMEHMSKGKPKELHLKITTYENHAEKIYKDIPLFIKY
jgi:hypothetical protein